MFSFSKPGRLPEPDEALPGRETPLPLEPEHAVTGISMLPPYPSDTAQLLVGMGCFWGAERLFWQQPGVYVTAAGYAGGLTPNPTYEEVCSGMTGHTEVVLVVYHAKPGILESLLKCFWENHDPTQGMRQGNDIGTQYRSAIYYQDETLGRVIEASRDRYQKALLQAGAGPITTEIRSQVPFYFAESYHQQYLAKHPDGYCGLQGTGIRL